MKFGKRIEENNPVLRLQGSKRGRSSTPSGDSVSPSKRHSETTVQQQSSSSTHWDNAPTGPILPFADQSDHDEHDGIPPLREESDDEGDDSDEDAETVAYEDESPEDQEHDFYTQAWWDSVQSWCWRMKVDVKHFFNVAEVVNLADPNFVAPRGNCGGGV